MHVLYRLSLPAVSVWVRKALSHSPATSEKVALKVQHLVQVSKMNVFTEPQSQVTFSPAAFPNSALAIHISTLVFMWLFTCHTAYTSHWLDGRPSRFAWD